MNEETKTTTTMIFRIEPHLKKAFEQSAKERDLTASQLLRAFIRHEVEKYRQRHAQGALDLSPTPRPQPSEEKPAKARKTPVVTVNNQRKRKK